MEVNAGIDTPEASINDVGGQQQRTLTWTVKLHGLYRKDRGDNEIAPVPVLFGAATVLALSGLWLRVAGPRCPTSDPVQLRLPAQQSPGRGRGDIAPANYQPIVAQNIFAQSRAAAPAKPPAPHGRRPRPTGPTTTSCAGRRSARAAPWRSSVPTIHRVGDIVDGAKLVAITDSTVTLERPNGAPGAPRALLSTQEIVKK